MAADKFGKLWTLIAIFLVLTIIGGGIAIWLQYKASQPVEISILHPTSQGQPNYIYIGGAVATPGFYPVEAEDNIDALVQAAGGTTTNADTGWLKLYVPVMEEGKQPQRIDINRAEAWLLEALPGIGEIRAQAIIEYRSKKGFFRHVADLIKVEGISIITYEKIKDMITVAD